MSGEASLRIDKWLWFSRFFKSRTLASRLCEAGRIRVNARVIDKAHHAVKPGDILTFAQGPHIRVVRILALGSRRGPASEARTFYDDLVPPTPRSSSVPEERSERLASIPDDGRVAGLSEGRGLGHTEER